MLKILLQFRYKIFDNPTNDWYNHLKK